MATKCNSTKDLEVHHINRMRGDSLDNAEVLCHNCHVNTSTYGVPGKSPKPFTQWTKDYMIKEVAKGECQCTRENCHD